MAEKSSVVAKAALGVSLATACFTIFQWWNGQRETRITAAIEVSRSYLRETGEREMFPMMAAYMGRTLSQEQLLTLGRQVDILDYIATLANNGRLDEGYLSNSVQCGMIVARRAVEHVRKSVPQTPESSEIAKLSKRVTCDSIQPLDTMTDEDFRAYGKQFPSK